MSGLRGNLPAFAFAGGASRRMFTSRDRPELMKEEESSERIRQLSDKSTGQNEMNPCGSAKELIRFSFWENENMKPRDMLPFQGDIQLFIFTIQGVDIGPDYIGLSARENRK